MTQFLKLSLWSAAMTVVAALVHGYAMEAEVSPKVLIWCGFGFTLLGSMVAASLVATSALATFNASSCTLVLIVASGYFLGYGTGGMVAATVLCAFIALVLGIAYANEELLAETWTTSIFALQAGIVGTSTFLRVPLTVALIIALVGAITMTVIGIAGARRAQLFDEE